MNTNRQVVIRRQQPHALGHDAMPVVVGIAGESNIEAVLHGDEGLHRILRRWVHADPAIPVERHEAEHRIDNRIHDLEIQTIAFGNRFPVVGAISFGTSTRSEATAICPAPESIFIQISPFFSDYPLSAWEPSY